LVLALTLAFLLAHLWLDSAGGAHQTTWFAVWKAFHDPKDGKVKLDGENVLAFPKLPEFQQVTLKVLRWEERDKRLVIKDAEIMA
jgi:hypothetical protein